MTATATLVLEPVGGFFNFAGVTSSNWAVDRHLATRSKKVEQTSQGEGAIFKQSDVIAKSTADINSLDKRQGTIDESYQEVTFSKRKDAMLGAIRKLVYLTNGWDGEDAQAPTAGIVDDAMAVAMAWPAQLPLPTIGVDVDGHIVLDLINSKGFVVAGFDFIGRDRLAVYSVVGGPSGKIDTTATTAILKAFLNLRDLVVDGGK